MKSAADYIDLQRVGMVFATPRGPYHALRSIDLRIARGEFVTLIGHSGCGKSTLLNLIAGLLTASEGLLLCDGREIASPGPDRAVVFQNQSLLPWFTCYENVQLAVERVFGAKETRAQRKERVMEALELVGMAHATHRRPHEISGAMKQRVGIARAFAMEPKVLLLDEPFFALDALTRAHLQDELLKIVERAHTTVVMATHDIDEAVLLSDRIVMMTNGPATTIGEVAVVGLPHPRDRVALVDDPACMRVRRQVMEFLYTRPSRLAPLRA